MRENRQDEIHQIINSKLPNYPDKQKKQLKKFLAGFDDSKIKKARSIVLQGF